MQAQQQNLFNNLILTDNHNNDGLYGPNPTDCLDINSATTTASSGGAAAGQSEHYIYVTYPPELKRRLLERYDRETYSMFKN